jgi:Cys-rich repeat protein
MTDERFDNLTRSLGKATSRRTIFKGLVAAAVGGVLAKASGGGDAEARARIRMACARLGQPCGSGPGTPGNMVCCPHLTCGDDAVCCKATNESCGDDNDCCGGDVCRPNPSGAGNHCLPPGDLGAECLEDSDCAAGLTCDVYTGTCGGNGGAECAVDSDCATGFVCDPYTLTCVPGGSDPNGTPCVSDGTCASGSCCPPEGICKPAANVSAACATDDDCCGTDICSGSVCFSCANPGQFCFNDSECCSGACSSGGSGQGVCLDYPLNCDPLYDPTCGVTCSTVADCPHQECQDTFCTAGMCDYLPTSNGIDCGTSGFATCQNGVCTEQCRAEQEQCDTDDQCCDPSFVCRPGAFESTTRCQPPLTLRVR